MARLSVNQKMKGKFRGSKEWKEFRAYMRDKQKVDPITGAKLTRMANLHHLCVGFCIIFSHLSSNLLLFSFTASAT